MQETHLMQATLLGQQKADLVGLLTHAEGNDAFSIWFQNVDGTFTSASDFYGHVPAKHNASCKASVVNEIKAQISAINRKLRAMDVEPTDDDAHSMPLKSAPVAALPASQLTEQQEAA